MAGSSLTESFARAHNVAAVPFAAAALASFLALAGLSLTELFARAHNVAAVPFAAITTSFLALAGSSLAELFAQGLTTSPQCRCDAI